MHMLIWFSCPSGDNTINGKQLSTVVDSAARAAIEFDSTQTVLLLTLPKVSWIGHRHQARSDSACQCKHQRTWTRRPQEQRYRLSQHTAADSDWLQ